MMSDLGHQPLTQMHCYITHTNEKTHDIIKKYMHQSPIFQQRMDLKGPRYCPSIEQKIDRFSQKSSHQIFIEPEGIFSQEIYPNGISTSLPFEAQIKFIQTIKGFENAQITRAGYAVSYGYFDPRGLTPWLETKIISGLFFAGQINGTTGYEEAGAQGIMAGINAALMLSGKNPWVMSRSEGYIGVLIDDLVTNGTIEPYRMFTSRAEHRLTLRSDNAHMRLTPKGIELGVVGQERQQWFKRYQNERARIATKFATERIKVNQSSLLLEEYVRQERYDIKAIKQLLGEGDQQLIEDAIIESRYAGYVARQERHLKRLRASESIRIPEDFCYHQIKGLSNEALEKLNTVKPQTIAQALRISGVTPAAVAQVAAFIATKPRHNHLL
jgi:tRNA uridine 5-carboxymethylaminomethyl modification enzyme